MERPDAANPFGDFTKMLEQFKLPGFDVPAIMEARRKDVEALVTANQAALQGMQSLAQKQAEMLRSTLSELQSMATQFSTSGVHLPRKRRSSSSKPCTRHWPTCSNSRRRPISRRPSRTQSSPNVSKRTCRNSRRFCNRRRNRNRASSHLRVPDAVALATMNNAGADMTSGPALCFWAVVPR